MVSRVVFASVFALVTLLAACWLCYLGLSGNSSLLGPSPTIEQYLQATLASSWFLTLPLLIGAATCFFVESRRLPWVPLTLVVLGAVWLHSTEPSFVLLLVYPFNILVCWVLGIRCMSHSKSLLALPVLVAFAGLVLASVVSYARLTEQRAEQMARALCSVRPGTDVASLVARAAQDKSHHVHVRWVQVQDQLRNGEGTLSVMYRGTNLLHVNVCELKATNGTLIGTTYRVQ
jgi:hypothetical protein